PCSPPPYPPPPYTPPPSAGAGPSNPDAIEMNFRNVDIVNFLTIMSDSIGVPFLWNDQEIKGKITLVSPKKFSRKDAYKLFETVLAMHGFTTVRSKSSPVVQVVPIQDASRYPGQTGDEEGGRGNSFITRIVSLKYADPNQVKAALTPLLNKNASLAVYPPANVMILSDVSANVERLMSIITTLDVEPGDISYQVIPLEYASAQRLAAILTSVVNAISRPVPGRPPVQPGQMGGVTVVAEERINALVIVADPSTLSQMNKLITALDQPGKTEMSGFKVYRLANASAEEMEKVLNRVKAGAEAGSTAKGVPQASLGGQGPPPGLTITSDNATNSLIVFGPPDMMITMDKIITQLDVRRAQVYVEALIMETTLDKSLQLGIKWQTANLSPDGVIGGGFPNSSPSTLDQALGSGTGAVVGVIGNQITFQGQTFNSFTGFIEATRQDTDLNILANPQLLTLDNQEAEINVSQVIPVSTKTVRGQDLLTTTEFEFKDVGIILKITPQITGNNKVQLKINQESSSVAAAQVLQSQSNQQAITTLKRTIHSTVLVDNSSTVAIGGLIQDKEISNEVKVPCLGDIPILGWFFKRTSEGLQKTNLIVFIRPTIINSQADLARVTRRVQERYDATRKPSANTRKTLRKGFGLDKTRQGRSAVHPPKKQVDIPIAPPQEIPPKTSTPEAVNKPVGKAPSPEPKANQPEKSIPEAVQPNGVPKAALPSEAPNPESSPPQAKPEKGEKSEPGETSGAGATLPPQPPEISTKAP
ncbi:MAG: type II secretion system secretin GspD, partial [Deltaproteobacteria bacterium]|nr:type II secretion system secretin GspD [Deltaproteobacteria bacterium]